MKLIKKTFPFNIIEFTSQIPLKDYALISDTLVQEIENQFYKDGTIDEFGNEVLIDLKLITKVNSSPIEGKLYENCDSLNYKNRSEEILNFEKAQIDNSFYGFLHKIELYDKKALLEVDINFSKLLEEIRTAANNGLAEYFEKPIIIDSSNSRFRTEVTVFIDYINVTERSIIEGIQVTGEDGELHNLITITENPTKTEEETIEIILE